MWENDLPKAGCKNKWKIVYNQNEMYFGSITLNAKKKRKDLERRLEITDFLKHDNVNHPCILHFFPIITNSSFHLQKKCFQ